MSKRTLAPQEIKNKKKDTPLDKHLLRIKRKTSSTEFIGVFLTEKNL